jgi:DNA invertase Pin-like site-specific DNA recombinase
MPRRAYSYDRVSRAKKDGQSLTRQDTFADQICAEEGWNLDDSLIFVDRSRSGYHKKNLTATADLTRLLSLINDGTIVPGSVIVIENIDRLSRADVDTAHDLFRSILKAGVWIATKTPKRIYRSGAVGLMELMEPIWLMFLAHEESAKKADRALWHWMEKRKEARKDKKAHQGPPPMWLKKEGSAYVFVPEVAELVRRAAGLVVAGEHCATVARRLNQAGETGLVRCGIIRPDVLKRLLSSRSLIGEYHPHRLVDGKRVPEGEPIQGYYPALLTADVFTALQNALGCARRASGRPAGPARVNVLKGLLTHRPSGRSMAMQSFREGERVRPYLVATTTDGAVRVPYGVVLDCVLSTVRKFQTCDLLPPDKARDAREAKLAALTERFTALRARQRRLQEQAADVEQDESVWAVPLAAVTEELKAVTKQREALIQQTTSGRTDALGRTQSLVTQREEAEGEEQRRVDETLAVSLPMIVRSIDVQVERLTFRTRVIRLTLHLHNGEARHVRIDP